jgi:MOSC domain-containing protein YiiM
VKRLVVVCEKWSNEMIDPPSLSSAHGNDLARQDTLVSQGTVASLYLAPAAHVPMVSLTSAHLIPGRGVVGDRFYLRRGTDAKASQASCDVTLIEYEAIEYLRLQHPQTNLDASARRNIVVRACSLVLLVGRTFHIGTVTLRGLAPRTKDAPLSLLPETTANLSLRMTPVQQAAGCGILPPHIHLRAEVLTEGTIHVDDQIRLMREECS